MKQHITAEQLKELSKPAYKKLAQWANEKNYVGQERGEIVPGSSYIPLPQLTIGQMIEFLAENIDQWYIEIGNTPMVVPVWELCDSLWEHVKEVLQKEIAI